MTIKNDFENYEIFPYVHNNKFYNLITELDLELAEVRELLDYIEEHGLMEIQMKEHSDMPLLCEIELTNAKFVVDLMNYEILIYKREEIK